MCDTLLLGPSYLGVEDQLSGPKSLPVINLDGVLLAWNQVRPLLLIKRVPSMKHLVIIVNGDRAHLFLNLPDEFKVLIRDRLLLHYQLPNQLVCHVLACDVIFVNSMWESVTLKDGHRVTNSFSTFSHHTSSLTCREQTEYGSIHHSQ